MSQALLDCYKAIEAASVRMLQAAQMQDWEGIAQCEGVCSVLIEQLRSQSQGLELASSERAEKTRIMLRILKNDAQIREWVEPWVAELDSGLLRCPQFLH